MYGTIEYNQDGMPKCEICGKHFKRVLPHVRQKHNLNQRDYKKQFGFDVKKGICSQESAEKSRDAVIAHYDLVVAENLVGGGEKTRFKAGDKGRTKDQVSEQTRLRLLARLKQEPMHSILVESGRKLGKPNIGNKIRYGKK